MKNKTVHFYVDLRPGWHEQIASEMWLSACTQPTTPKFDGHIRVKITAELPHNERLIEVDETVKACSEIVP
jgi:hypothetical protein